MAELQVIAHTRSLRARRGKVLSLLAELAEISRTEPGNVSFIAYRRLDQQQEMVLLERYTRPTPWTSTGTQHFKDLVLAQIVPRLDSRVVETYEVTD
jgi:quinol monooxygenase YgiN